MLKNSLGNYGYDMAYRLTVILARKRSLKAVKEKKYLNFYEIWNDPDEYVYILEFEDEYILVTFCSVGI